MIACGAAGTLLFVMQQAQQGAALSPAKGNALTPNISLQPPQTSRRKNRATIALGALIALVCVMSFAKGYERVRPREKSMNPSTSPEYQRRRDERNRLLSQGVQFMRKKKYKQAEACLRKCGYAFVLADALEAQGRYKEALVAFEHDMAGYSPGFDYPEGQLKYGRLLGHLGRRQEALTAYRRAFKLLGKAFPFPPTGRESDDELEALADVALATYKKGNGDVKGAVEDYKKVLQNHPNLTAARKALEIAWAELHR